MQTDHLGNSYPSRKVMCTVWNVSEELYKSRRRRGWSLEQALITPVDDRYSHSASSLAPITDYRNNKYDTVRQMCDAYHIDPKTYRRRIQAGWSKKPALTTHKKPATRPEKAQSNGIWYDHKGNPFASKQLMCTYYGIHPNTFGNRILSGWTLEEALTIPVNIKHHTSRKHLIIYDHKGNPYSTTQEMCDTYHITVKAYAGRIARGFSLEKALTTPLKSKRRQWEDPWGNPYSSLSEMLSYYHITKKLYEQRLYERRWSFEEALLLSKNRMYQTVHVDTLAYTDKNTGKRNYFCECGQCGWKDIADFNEIRSHQCIKNQ